MAENISDSACCTSSNTVDNVQDLNDLTGEFAIDYWNAEAEQDAEEPNDLDVGIYNQDIDVASSMGNAVILELPKFSKCFEKSDFDEFVWKYVGEENLERLENQRFPNLWIMVVATKEIRESLLRLWKTKIKNKICCINPYYSYELRGFLYWLPHFISDEDVKTQLSQFGDVLLLEKEIHSRWNGRIHSEARYFGLRLRDGMVKNDMPHFLKFDGYRTLVIIRGRKPACFHCREFGHSKKDCQKYKEKLNEYCENPEVGKPRIKPRGRRHRPEFDVQKDSQDNNHQDGVQSTSNSVPVKKSNRDMKLNKQKPEILAVLQSLKTWKEETIEMVEQTLLNTEKKLKTIISQIKMEEKSIEISIETIVKRSLDEIKRTTIEMTEKTLNNLKNMVTKHCNLDPNETLENLIINFQMEKVGPK